MAVEPPRAGTGRHYVTPVGTGARRPRPRSGELSQRKRGYAPDAPM